jgi:hypothetical protein
MRPIAITPAIAASGAPTRPGPWPELRVSPSVFGVALAASTGNALSQTSPTTRPRAATAERAAASTTRSAFVCRGA